MKVLACIFTNVNASYFIGHSCHLYLVDMLFVVLWWWSLSWRLLSEFTLIRESFELREKPYLLKARYNCAAVVGPDIFRLEAFLSSIYLFICSHKAHISEIPDHNLVAPSVC